VTPTPDVLELAFKAGFNCGQVVMAMEENETGVTYWPERIPADHVEQAHVAWVEWSRENRSANRSDPS
jgi:hypothetical protein